MRSSKELTFEQFLFLKRKLELNILMSYKKITAHKKNAFSSSGLELKCLKL